MAKKIKLPATISETRHRVLQCYDSGDPVVTSDVIAQCSDINPKTIYTARYQLVNDGYLIKLHNGLSQLSEQGRYLLDNIDHVTLTATNGKTSRKRAAPPPTPAPAPDPIDIDVTADQLVTNISSVIHANSEYRAMLKKQVVAYRRQADEIEQFLNSKKTD